MQVELNRDRLNTPWGFRLSGGKDVHASLTVQKIEVGSPAFSELRCGDVIFEIQGQNATRMSHLRAQEVIRNAGGVLVLRLHRFGHQKYYNSIAPTGLALAALPPPQKGFMLNRLHDTLNTILYKPKFPDYSDQHFHDPTCYPTLPMNRVRKNSAPSHHSSNSLWEPGWTPRPQFNTLRPGHVIHARRSPPRENEPDQPAWSGSLRSSGLPHVCDRRPNLSQHEAPRADRFDPASAGVFDRNQAQQAALLQYNSPLRLYNKATPREQAYQIHGPPGHGAANVKYNSEVTRIIQEHEGISDF